MIAVFGDTYYFLALLNQLDAAHRTSVEFSRSYTGLVLTTQYVLTELLDGLSAPSDRKRAAELVRFLESNRRFRILPANETNFEAGLQLYENRPDKAWSLTDCISFSLMTKNRITDALTADHDFEQAGFRALLK